MYIYMYVGWVCFIFYKIKVVPFEEKVLLSGEGTKVQLLTSQIFEVFFFFFGGACFAP